MMPPEFLSSFLFFLLLKRHVLENPQNGTLGEIEGALSNNEDIKCTVGFSPRIVHRIHPEDIFVHILNFYNLGISLSHHQCHWGSNRPKISSNCSRQLFYSWCKIPDTSGRERGLFLAHTLRGFRPGSVGCCVSEVRQNFLVAECGEAKLFTSWRPGIRAQGKRPVSLQVTSVTHPDTPTGVLGLHQASSSQSHRQ